MFTIAPAPFFIMCFEKASEMLMTIQETHKDDISQDKLSRLSKTAHTYDLDYMIGNPKLLDKGYIAKSLAEFISYFLEQIDSKVDNFLTDPDSSNPETKHVYMKDDLHICDFMMDGNVRRCSL